MQTVAVDFDGVIHKYSKGYADGTIYDEPVQGVEGFLYNLMMNHAVYIHSTRDVFQIQDWMARHFQIPTIIVKGRGFWKQKGVIAISNEKIPAIAYIDDRAIKFDGSWIRVWSELRKIEHHK